jgi:hypothetical protein
MAIHSLGGHAKPLRRNGGDIGGVGLYVVNQELPEVCVRHDFTYY